MEDYYKRRSYVPAFGSWDWSSDIPFTQCFESLQYSYPEDPHLYVAGLDLHPDEIIAPAVIVLPRRQRTKGRQVHVKKEKQSNWTASDVNAPPSLSPTIMTKNRTKPVDQDLYRISPDLLLYAKATKKRGLGFLSSCLMPTCAT